LPIAVEEQKKKKKLNTIENYLIGCKPFNLINIKVKSSIGNCKKLVCPISSELSMLINEKS
jgi:hypothetical protein